MAMTTDTPEPETAVQGGEAGRRRPRRSRRRRLAAGAAVLGLAVAGGVFAAVRPFGGHGRPPAPASSGTSLATVQEGPLSAQIYQSGTLSYAAQRDGTPYTVIGRAAGVYTRLPEAGQVIGCGQVLYRVDDTPVPLLCGSYPAYRNLSEGDSGRDVRELNRALVDLGYADRAELDPASDYFGAATADALERLQDHIGADETGTLALGDAVFLPGPLRIGKVTARLGANAMPGGQVAEATSTGRQVTVDLDASQQAQVKVGDKAQITLPGNRTTTGKVSRIGTVASSSGSSGSGGSDTGSGSSNATIPVYITLAHPKDAGDLDQAPVQVQITTAGVRRALIVPVTALLGRPGGGYAVEKAAADGTRTMVPVTLGLFDDASGSVQVFGGLSAGDRVVVPAT